MAQPTQAERAAFLWMQGRMVELLLRHDLPRFGKTFGEQIADELAHPELARYRELAVLFYLRDELFNSILPRIKRRLSFEAPRELKVEALPPRGRIDWGRTIAASWRERPGEPPLDVQTRQRRRHFATPENLLTVATIIEYRAAAQLLLDAEAAHDSALAIRHPLHEIAEQCTRELAFVQFAGLAHEAQAIVDSVAEMPVGELEAAVAERALPGHNSAYDELLDWRRKLRRLQLLDRTSALAPQPMLGADPSRDNYLYQLWLFYELGDLLQRTNRLLEWHIGGMRLTYTWGNGAEQRSYALTHDQEIPQHWLKSPGVRPDLYIARIDREQLTSADHVLWQAPGYVLDAKYYRPHDSPKAPSNPVKRLLADLHLTGERHGALLFAFQEHDAQPNPNDANLPPEPGLLYLVERAAHADALVPGESKIAIWRVQPRLDRAAAHHEVLAALLDRVHCALRERPTIACYGVLPDADTISPSGSQAARCHTCGEVLAFCPKPHISPRHIDYVCPRCHCLRSAQHCHIIGQASVSLPPFVKRVQSTEDLIASAGRLRSWLKDHVRADDTSPESELARQSVLRTIGDLTESYVKLTRADTRQTERGLRDYKFGAIWSDEQHPRGLPKEVRSMLISGEFVWGQFQTTTIDDWAACAVQYTRALEYEIHRRLYGPCGQRLVTKDGLPMQGQQFTIGSVIYLYRDRRRNTNWSTILALVAQPSGADEQTIKQLCEEIEALREDRNKVAHTQHVDEQLAGKIRTAVLGLPGQPGLLYRLCSQLKPPQAGGGH